MQSCSHFQAVTDAHLHVAFVLDVPKVVAQPKPAKQPKQRDAEPQPGQQPKGTGKKVAAK
jgi:hypothetical protein